MANPTTVAEYTEQIQRANRWWNAKRYQWAVIGAVFTVIMGFATVIVRVRQLDAPSEVVTECILLVIIAAVTLGIAALLFWKSLKYQRFHVTAFPTHFVAHIVRNEVHRLSRVTSKDVVKGEAVQIVQTVLEAVRCCFAIILGVNCRATLKVFLKHARKGTEKSDKTVDEYEHGSVATYARDLHTIKMMQGIDESNRVCSFKGNERFYAFQENPALRCVVIPDVTDAQNRYNRNDDTLRFQRKLPYLSQMIWTVRCPLPSGQGECKQDLLGFLIVDCYRKAAFKERELFDIGASFADVLYTFLDQLHVLIPDATAVDVQAEELVDVN